MKGVVSAAQSAAPRNAAGAGAPLPAALSAIERVRLARNPSRPQTLDYVEHLVRDFFEIHGDRRFADDGAIVAGLGYFGRRAVAIVGHQRGRSTQERIRRNFGKPHPEGYRKAARMYDLASRMGVPLITFIDTQGAEPGLGAEERGQAEAIAANLELMMRLEVPVIACVIGEGGSGGALALGVANVVLMQENACYSVITPEGCAAILWREGGPERVADAAAALKLPTRSCPSRSAGRIRIRRAPRARWAARSNATCRASYVSRRFGSGASAKRSSPRWARRSFRVGALKIRVLWARHLRVRHLLPACS
jgi:acetyl-CoA carboxylase carboxyl transferase alpha subunit